MDIEEYIDFAEKRIHRKGMSISSWYSSSRGNDIGGVKTDLLVRGNMRVKGFVFSRMWSWTAPKWETLAVVFSYRGTGKASAEKLKKLVVGAEKYMSENDITWSWLVYVSKTGFDVETIAFAEGHLKKETGIMLVDLSSKQFYSNKVLVSKHGARVFKP
jgi:hypothetical protein